ncbi:MAG: STAS domain-containing protein [Deltaproteobacteria bacterium]|jgi:anti-anti-sigma factor|nr:STAS domain-containing protein [Deltaproteobacteria bacterium]
MYQLTLERFELILIARFIGDLTLPEAVNLRHELEQVVKQEKAKDLVLDLALVNNVDNSGLGVLVAVSTFARSYGKRLILCHVTDAVNEALAQAAINGFFPLLEDDEDLLTVMPD